jgi:DNA-directed RNA polymerase subunit RPC12/RpoP
MGRILCPECEKAFLSWSKELFFACDNCGFKVTVKGDPFDYLRTKSKEIEKWEQDSPCNRCVFVNYCEQGQQQNKNTTWKRREQQFCMPKITV